MVATNTFGPPSLPTQVWHRMSKAVHGVAAEEYGAFYSSVLGGITSNPALMCVPVDDAMVHRGYGVCEAVRLVDGYLYQLPQHVERLRDSAGRAGFASPFSDIALMRIILDTAAASKRPNGEQ